MTVVDTNLLKSNKVEIEQDIITFYQPTLKVDINTEHGQFCNDDYEYISLHIFHQYVVIKPKNKPEYIIEDIWPSIDLLMR